MKDSIVKALLFVIALGTSIIAVELIPISMVNRGKLFCAEYNSKYIDKDLVLKKFRSFIGEEKNIVSFCNNL